MIFFIFAEIFLPYEWITDNTNTHPLTIKAIPNPMYKTLQMEKEEEKT